jgi:hypothetical protein
VAPQETPEKQRAFTAINSLGKISYAELTAVNAALVPVPVSEIITVATALVSAQDTVLTTNVANSQSRSNRFPFGLWMVRQQRVLDKQGIPPIRIIVPRRRMPLPATRDEFIALGWQYTNDGVCTRCHKPIEWWISPKKHAAPISVLEQLKDGQVVYLRQSHFADCPFAAEFRKKKKR